MRFLTFSFALFALAGPAAAELIEGSIQVIGTNEPIEARLYIESLEDGKFYHAESASADGEAIPYSKIRGVRSQEVHTTLSAHRFRAEVPQGRYRLTVERGKEWLPSSREIQVGPDGAKADLKMAAWIDMSDRGWYSGETHVHRPVSELPLLMRAEELNVTLPLTAWVTDSREAPSTHNKNPIAVPPAELIEVGPDQVIWPINTEYEIFTIDGNRHTLGAVFVLNHRETLELKAPPAGPIAAEARRQGALLDLDKHNWPWSAMIVPQMKVDLFELTNNHIWRTNFPFSTWYPEYAADYMNLEMENGNFTERGWIDFGFQNYYAFLNCGFDMKPSAGTASGVHPVPLGFGRVYVELENGFDYDAWIDGLAAGRSFVTTGPMLLANVSRKGDEIHIVGSLESLNPQTRIEVIVNGEVREQIEPNPGKTRNGAFQFLFGSQIPAEPESMWVAVRAFTQTPNGRPRFAHTAPVHFSIEGKPIRPRKAEIEYLIKRVEDELARHREVLKSEALQEYEAALEFYHGLEKNAR